MILARRPATQRRLIILSILSLVGILTYTISSTADHSFPVAHLTDLSSGHIQKLWQDGLQPQAWLGSVHDFFLGEEDGAYCQGWNPDSSPSLDDPRCLKAKQYRQVQRVLKREEEAKHPHWYFTTKWNIEVFQNLTRCYLPVAHPEYTKCPEQPLIVSGWWYTAEVVYGATSGEVIWMTSIVNQLKEEGVQIAHMGPYENWVEVYEMMPDVVRFVWNDDRNTISCIGDPRCIAKEHYSPDEGSPDLSVGIPEEERGVVPIWKLLVVDWWGARPSTISNNEFYWSMGPGEWSYQPLGQKWVATPWELPGHSYLPYTLDGHCPPAKPYAERNDSALVFAKRSSYFGYSWVPKPDIWSQLNDETDFDLVVTAAVEEGHPLPDGLNSLGGMSRADYQDLVGSVKVMIGMGFPLISPSVYQALCQGTPVVLPYYEEMPDLDGWGMYSGWSQHGPAAKIGPPYVYSYQARNYSSLLDTVRLAMSTPIDPFSPEDMTTSSVASHLRRYINTDWYGEYESALTRNNGVVPGLKVKILERCFELNRCYKLAEGRRPYSTPDLSEESMDF